MASIGRWVQVKGNFTTPGGDTVECTKINCPMQAGTTTDRCGDNCPWRTTAKEDDLISRAAALDVLVTSPMFHITLARMEELPAVDAVPVVHACWILDGPGLTCSACGEWVDSEISYMLSPRQVPKCCPYCGAKMDKEDK